MPAAFEMRWNVVPLFWTTSTIPVVLFVFVTVQTYVVPPLNADGAVSVISVPGVVVAVATPNTKIGLASRLVGAWIDAVTAND